MGEKIGENPQNQRQRTFLPFRIPPEAEEPENLNLTPKLWKKGIWLSQNDVLRIGLIFWILYIATIVTGRVADYTVNVVKLAS